MYLFVTRLFVQDYHRYDPRILHYIVKNLASNLTQESEDQTRFININKPQDCWQDCLSQECSQNWSQILCHFLYLKKCTISLFFFNSFLELYIFLVMPPFTMYENNCMEPTWSQNYVQSTWSLVLVWTYWIQIEH